MTERSSFMTCGERPVFLALKAHVFNDFKTAAETVGEFGLTLPQRRKPTPEKLMEAAAKRKATRYARHTMGPKQKEAIKGQLPAAPPPPKA
jgi:hypothetical protein